jgi:hypothetical protein
MSQASKKLVIALVGATMLTGIAYFGPRSGIHLNWRVENILRILFMPFFLIGVVFGEGLHDSNDAACYLSFFAFVFLAIFIAMTRRCSRKTNRSFSDSK